MPRRPAKHGEGGVHEHVQFLRLESIRDERAKDCFFVVRFALHAQQSFEAKIEAKIGVFWCVLTEN